MENKTEELKDQAMAKFKKSSELRAQALVALKGNWTTMVLAGLAASAAYTLASMIPYIGIVFVLAVFPLLLGFYFMCLDIVRTFEPRAETLFEPYSRYLDYILGMLLVSIFTILWMLLLVIPGIIKGYAYSMTFFIMRDNPNVEAREAIRMSEAMMAGRKMDLFMLHLSFIGWILLACLTAGIGFLWLVPYAETAQAAFYEDLKKNSPYAVKTTIA